MFHIIILYLLVLNSMVCLGYESTYDFKVEELGKQGIVFQWAPTEKISILMYDNSVLTKEDKFKDGIPFKLYSNDEVLKGLKTNSKSKDGEDKEEKKKEKGLMYCRTWAKNKGTEMEFTQTRLSVRVVDIYGFPGEEIELDEFEVTSCDENVIKSLILVTTQMDNKYILYFKDNAKSNNCYEKEIEVKEKELKMGVTVTHKEPSSVKCNEKYLNALDYKFNTLTSNVISRSWTPNGDWYDIDHIQAYTNCVRLTQSVDNIVACCKNVKDQKYNVIDVLYAGGPIDRLYATSCNGASISTSIVLVDITGQVTKNVYINYLNPKGQCSRRRYEVTSMELENRFLRKSKIERFEFFPSDCWTQKFKGYVRAAGYLLGLRRLFYK